MKDGRNLLKRCIMSAVDLAAHCQDFKKGTLGLRNGMRASGLVYSRKSTMPQSNRDPNTDEIGERYLRDRTTPAARPTRRLTVWILPPKHCGTRQKTRLRVPRRMMSKKRQCSIGPV
jgi:hypothetical protein